MGPRPIVVKGRFNCIGDIRGAGLMVGVEMAKDRDTRQPDAELVGRLLTRCFEKGRLILSCGACTVRFMPPLIVDEAGIDEALKIFGEVLKED